MTTTLRTQSTTALTRLRWRWLATAVLWYTALMLGYWGLQTIWPYAARWAILAGLAMVYGLWVLWRGLPENYRPGETVVLPTLGWGNRLTLLRGLCISLVAGFLFSPWPEGWLAWLPMLLYTVADVADYFDGYLARITHHATGLGERLDMEFDGLGMLVVSLLAVWYGQIPWWYLSLGLARYLFVLGLWWRERTVRPVRELSPSVHRRIFAGFQMGFMSAVLWPIVPPAGATIAGTIFAGATAVSFGRDWLVVTGQLDPAAPGYRRWQRRLYLVMTRWLPPLLRLVLAASTAVIFASLSPSLQPSAWAELFAAWGWPGAVFLASVWVVIMLGAGTAVTLGVMGRSFSLLLVFPVGFDMVARGLQWQNGLTLACAACLMLLGTGKSSLWQTEERFMVHRAGEAASSKQ